MNKSIRISVLCLLLSACSTIENELFFVEQLTTRSVVTVTVCTDAFVDISVGGASGSFYKGTRCKTCQINMSELGADEYIAGGFPQYGTATNRGGGGSTTKEYYVGDDWHFEFDNLNSIYGAGSNLNVAQKDKLQHALNAYNIMPDRFAEIYQELKDEHIAIKFKLDSNIGYPALYNKTDRSIYFEAEASINWENLQEEVVHAVQHLVYYGNAMNPQYKNYEFEAKVFHDLTNQLAEDYENEDFYANAYRVLATDNRPEFAEAYQKWIKSISTRGSMPSSEYAKFNELCEMWQGYPGETIHNFTPKVLEAYFRKPRPPKNPKNQ